MDKKRLVSISVIAILGIVLDQITKYVAKARLEGEAPLRYLSDTVRLQYAENHGAFLGLGGSLPEWARTLIFTVLVTLFLVALTVWALKRSALSKPGMWALALVISGGVGNLIDRVINNGGVIDFMIIDFTFLGPGWLRTGIFNVADVWIVIGAVLLFIADDFRNEDKETKSESSNA